MLSPQTRAIETLCIEAEQAARDGDFTTARDAWTAERIAASIIRQRIAAARASVKAA